MTFVDLQGRLEELREALRLHQVVVQVGARGVGKSAMRSALVETLTGTGVHVVEIDAAECESLSDINATLAAALGCDERDLTASEIPDDRVIRVVVENCHRLYDRSWLDLWQEQWRLLFNSSEARGRLGALLLARPLFRKLAGGDGSPLLNAAIVLPVKPLSVDEVAALCDIDHGAAKAIARKTGGHPELSRWLSDAIAGDVTSLGRVIDGFVRQHDRYLMRLVEDHGLAAAGLLADLLEGDGSVPEATLIQANFATSYAEGQEALDDLAGSGLIGRVRVERCCVTAGLLWSMRATRTFVRVPLTSVPISEPGRHREAGELLYRAENRLRASIVQGLSALDPAWWTTRVEPKTAGEAESRRRAEYDSLAASDQELHPLMYLSFGELFGIVSEGSNWSDVFRLRFRRAAAMYQQSVTEVLAVRNKVAHNRPVSDGDYALLEGALGRLNLCD